MHIVHNIPMENEVSKLYVSENWTEKCSAEVLIYLLNMIIPFVFFKTVELILIKIQGVVCIMRKHFTIRL